jgi:hypothetical protein
MTDAEFQKDLATTALPRGTRWREGPEALIAEHREYDAARLRLWADRQRHFAAKAREARAAS